MKRSAVAAPVASIVLSREMDEALAEVNLTGRPLGVKVVVDGEFIRFTGPTGKHGISARERDTDLARFWAHAEGFLDATRLRARRLGEQLCLISTEASP